MNATQISRWIAMAEATIKRSISKSVVERAKSGNCLHCDKAASRRGLCVTHYFEFRRTLLSLPMAERADWEVQQIRDGRILIVGHVARLKSSNVFREAQ